MADALACPPVFGVHHWLVALAEASSSHCDDVPLAAAHESTVKYNCSTSCPWRNLPVEFGSWNSTYVRFASWADEDVWHNIFAVLREDAEFEEVFIDSTIVRAHQHAAMAVKKGDQVLGRSRGELTTKIHAFVEGLGQQAQFTLNAGQVHDATQAETLIERIEPAVVSANKAYDADALLACIDKKDC